MSESPDILSVSHARQTRTLTFARWDRATPLLGRDGSDREHALLLLSDPERDPDVHTVSNCPGRPCASTRPRAAQWPDHPFIHAQDKFGKKFGTSSLVAMGIVVRDGNIFTPETLKKLHEITRRLDGVGYDSQDRRARGAAREARGKRQERSGDPEGARPPVPALPGEPRSGALARALEHARGADRAGRLDHLRRPDEEGAGDPGGGGEAPRRRAPEPALHLRASGLLGREGRARHRRFHHRPPQ